MLSISDENPLPLTGKARSHPIKNDAKRIRNKCVDEIVEEIAWRDRIDYTEVISVTNVVHDDHENACSEDELEYETASDEDDDSDECDDGDDGDNNTDMED